MGGIGFPISVGSRAKGGQVSHCANGHYLRGALGGEGGGGPPIGARSRAGGRNLPGACKGR